MPATARPPTTRSERPAADPLGSAFFWTSTFRLRSTLAMRPPRRLSHGTDAMPCPPREPAILFCAMLENRWAMLAVIFISRTAMGLMYQSLAAVGPFVIEDLRI